MAISQLEYTMTKDMVPSWLHDSFFFENLEDEGEFTIDSRFVCSSDVINDIDDFVLVIQAMSYWDVKRLPLSVKYALERKLIGYDQFDTIRGNFPCISESYWNIMDVFLRSSIYDTNELEQGIKAVSHFDLQDCVPRFIYEFVCNKYYDTDWFINNKSRFKELENLDRFWDKMIIISLNSKYDAIVLLCKYDYGDALEYICSIASDFDKRSVCMEAYDTCINETNRQILIDHGVQFESEYSYE